MPALKGLAGEILFTIVSQHAESALKAVVDMSAPGGGDVPGASPASLPLALLSLPLLIAVFLLLLITRPLLVSLFLALLLLITTTSSPLLITTISLPLLITTSFLPMLITASSLPLLITIMTLPSIRTSVTRAPIVDSPPLTVRRLSGGAPRLFLWRESMVVTTPVLLVVITLVSISTLLDTLLLVMRSFFELSLSLGHVNTGHVVYQHVMVPE